MFIYKYFVTYLFLLCLCLSNRWITRHYVFGLSVHLCVYTYIRASAPEWRNSPVGLPSTLVHPAFIPCCRFCGSKFAMLTFSSFGRHPVAIWNEASSLECWASVLQSAMADGKTTSPSRAVSSRGSDVTSSPGEWRANLRKTNSVCSNVGGSSSIDTSTNDRSDADQLSRSSSLSTKTSVFILLTSIIYFTSDRRFEVNPS